MTITEPRVSHVNERGAFSKTDAGVLLWSREGRYFDSDVPTQLDLVQTVRYGT